MVMNGLSFADSIIWRDPNPYTWWDGKVYCDIVSRIKSEFNIGLPAAGVGVCRFLADATNPDPSYTDLKHTRFRRNMIDLFLGIGLPLINMGLKMIVNPTRYWIQGVEGCDGVTDLSWPSILLYHIWCPVLSSIAAIYSGINCLPLLLTCSYLPSTLVGPSTTSQRGVGSWYAQRNFQGRVSSTPIHRIVSHLFLLSLFIIRPRSNSKASADTVFVEEGPWVSMVDHCANAATQS